MKYEFGKYLRNLRESKGMTLEQLSEKSGVSTSQISRIESGKRGVPKPPTIKKLSDALGVSYVELMVLAGHWPEDELLEPIDKNKIYKIHEDKNKIYKNDQPKESSSPYTEKELSEIPIEELANHTLTYKGHVLTDEQKEQIVKILQAAAEMLEKK